MRSLRKIFLISGGLTLTFFLCSCQEQEEPSFEIYNPSGQLITQSCSACHATSDEAIPKISKLTKQELIQSLTRYREEQGGETVMHRLARGYTQTDIELISETLGQPDE